MDYVATMRVPPTQTVWPADEVPRLTAGALHLIPDTPEPHVRFLLRIDLQDGKPVESPLQPDDYETVTRVCAEHGLTITNAEMTSAEWVPYLVTFNESPNAPDWQFAVRPPQDPYMVTRIMKIVTEEEHEKALEVAIAERRVIARQRGTMLPAEPWMSLNHLVLTREGLVQFCNLVCIRVENIAPHFITSAWPKVIPSELLALAPDERITYEDNIGRHRGSGATNAGHYRDTVRETIEQQTCGFFTVNEAAQVLADNRPGDTGSQWAKDMQEAHRAGVLPIRDYGTRKPMMPRNPHRPEDIPKSWTAKQSAERDFRDLVAIADIDKWLIVDLQVGYCFPKAEGAAEPVPAARLAVTQETAPDRGRRVKPPQAFPAQEAEILKTLREQGHEPKQLPPRRAGKPWVKSAVWRAIGVCQLFTSERVFKKAWDRLRASTEIAERAGL